MTTAKAYKVIYKAAKDATLKETIVDGRYSLQDVTEWVTRTMGIIVRIARVA
jgi:hypothetical protein